MQGRYHQKRRMAFLFPHCSIEFMLPDCVAVNEIAAERVVNDLTRSTASCDPCAAANKILTLRTCFSHDVAAPCVIPRALQQTFEGVIAHVVLRIKRKPQQVLLHENPCQCCKHSPEVEPPPGNPVSMAGGKPEVRCIQLRQRRIQRFCTCHLKAKKHL